MITRLTLTGDKRLDTDTVDMILVAKNPSDLAPGDRVFVDGQRIATMRAIEDQYDLAHVKRVEQTERVCVNGTIILGGDSTVVVLLGPNQLNHVLGRDLHLGMVLCRSTGENVRITRLEIC